MLFKASAPGSLMLLGEYSVLEDGYAVVCAIDKRIKVYLSPRKDNTISIQSHLGQFTCDLSGISVEGPFQFVLTTLLQYQSFLKTGCDLKIESEFSSTLGLGSSAAVVVATLGVLNQWIQRFFEPKEFIQKARSIIQLVQGVGSGADVAASVLGGVIAYKKEPISFESLPHNFSISVIYSGSKTPTADAIRHVQELFSTRQEVLRQLYKKISECALSGINEIRNENWLELARIMQKQQTYMNELGVNNPNLNEIFEKLKQCKSILGAKISGSGLGDCVVAIGKVNEELHFENKNIQFIPVSISEKGMECAA